MTADKHEAGRAAGRADRRQRKRRPDTGDADCPEWVRGYLLGWHETSRPTGYSSHRFGPCEVCGKAAAEVSIRGIERGRNYIFGHAECLDGVPDERLNVAQCEHRRRHHGVEDCSCGICEVPA